MKTITIQPLEKPAHTEVTIPCSKSYTNRALMIGALTKGRVVITDPLFSKDTRAMIECLTALGIKIYTRPGEIEVAGRPGSLAENIIFAIRSLKEEGSS